VGFEDHGGCFLDWACLGEFDGQVVVVLVGAGGSGVGEEGGGGEESWILGVEVLHHVGGLL